MKLKIKTTYEWEEDASQMLQEYAEEHKYVEWTMEDFKMYFELQGPHIDSFDKLDACADNCINNDYTGRVELEWNDR